MNILIVEDEAILAITLQKRLEKVDNRVDIINSGFGAIEFLKDNLDVDVILMDISLNGILDGIETAEIILKWKYIPIIFCSSYSEYEILEKIKNINHCGFIEKGKNSLMSSLNDLILEKIGGNL